MTMAKGKVKRICDELKVSETEASLYLERSNWNLDEAMEACRTKTLLPVKSAPVNEESAAEESSATPSGVTSVQISSHEASIQREQQPRQSKDELIKSFLEVAVGRSVEDATAYLKRYSWNVDNAVLAFTEKRPLGIDRSANEGLNLGISSVADGTSSAHGFSGGNQTVNDSSTISDRKITQGSSTDDSTMDELVTAFLEFAPCASVKLAVVCLEAHRSTIGRSNLQGASSMETPFKEEGLVTASSQEEEISMPNSAEQKYVNQAVNCYFDQDRPNPKKHLAITPMASSELNKSKGIADEQDPSRMPQFTAEDIQSRSSMETSVKEAGNEHTPIAASSSQMEEAQDIKSLDAEEEDQWTADEYFFFC